MLLNISNHPQSTWSSEQISAAISRFMNIRDIPFPKIDPHWDENEIDRLSSALLSEIKRQLSLTPDEINAVHIMGELTFTYCLVNKLLAEGIKCIASTTERNTKTTAEGKFTKFNFIRFRDYPVMKY